jgi:hypothetical protein
VWAAILSRFEVRDGIVRGLYFPLLTAHQLASCAFCQCNDFKEIGVWDRLEAVAFILNALRLLGRLLSTFGGQASLNDRLYFPLVAAVNVLLVIWFHHLAPRESDGSA